MIEETALFIRQNYSEVRNIGLLATTGTYDTKIYQKTFLKHGLKILTPNKKIIAMNIMKAIYGVKGIKAGYKKYPKKLLQEASNYLISIGADLIIAGCTEIPLALKQKDIDKILLDPMKIIAMKSIYSLDQIKTEVIPN